MHAMIQFHTLRDLAGFVASSSSLPASSNSSSGVKSWVHRLDIHPSVCGVRLTAAKPVLAGATDSSSLDLCRSVVEGASGGVVPALARARSSSCSRCWRLLSRGAILAMTW